MYVIFDLDNTLVPTDSLRDARHSRSALDLVGSLSLQAIEPYPEVVDTLSALSHNATLAIVTSSPRWYTNQLLSHYFPAISLLTVVTYDDVTNIKPDPAGLLLAVSRAPHTASDTVFIGDDYVDYAAALAAGIPFVGAAWSPERTYPAGKALECDSPSALLNITGQATT